MARSIVDICNEALGEVPAEQIDDIDDTASMSARHCKRLFRGVIDDLLEFYNWDFATRRVALAQIANVRAGEWTFAYALPVDLRSPVGLIPNLADAGPYSVGATGSMGLNAQYFGSIEYVIADGMLFTHLEGAMLEYQSGDINPALFTAMFARLAALELACRLVMPVLNDGARQEKLINMAELQKQRAVADDAARNRSRSLDFVSDRARARGVAV